jgi:hypothetical protein
MVIGQFAGISWVKVDKKKGEERTEGVRGKSRESSERKREEARGSERKREKARESERKREKARESERKREKARESESEREREE